MVRGWSESTSGFEARQYRDAVVVVWRPGLQRLTPDARKSVEREAFNNYRRTLAEKGYACEIIERAYGLELRVTKYGRE